MKKYLIVKEVVGCSHISCVSLDKVWVSCYNNKLCLTDATTGDILYCVRDLLQGWSGFHAINGQQKLIYIAENFDIKKVSNKMKMTTFIKRKYSGGYQNASVFHHLVEIF